MIEIIYVHMLELCPGEYLSTNKLKITLKLLALMYVEEYSD